MEMLTLPTYISIILAGLSIFFGTKFGFIKRKLTAVINCLATIREALDDDKITHEEIKKIVDECKSLIGAK